MDDTARSVLDYGLHDHYSFDPRSVPDQQQLAREMELAIERFEPRLRLVRVRVDPPPDSSRTLTIHISARLNTDKIKEPVSFELTSDGLHGVGLVEDNEE